MPELLFYRQKRYDGGIRTGLELDGETVAEHFTEVQGERDPSLLWFVDLRCEGTGVPDDPDDAIQWLFDNSESIRDGFARFSEKLQVGADKDILSLKWSDFRDVPEGVSMIIACSSIRRIEGRELASIVAETGTHWLDYLHNELGLVQEAEGLH